MHNYIRKYIELRSHVSFYYIFLYFVLFSCGQDQTGCRILQRILEKKNPKHIEEIYNEALDHIIELMVDPFGNYLCQKLMEVCTSEQIEKIIDKSSDQLINASISVHGTRTVQKLIEMVTA